MKRFTSEKQKIGEFGENICIKFLKESGYEIKERNFTQREGEIDIIAKKSNILHFIEVKSVIKNPVSYETYNPAQNLTKRKFEKIKKTISIYLNNNSLNYENFQIDLYMVFIDKEDKKHHIKRIENITEIF